MLYVYNSCHVYGVCPQQLSFLMVYVYNICHIYGVHNLWRTSTTAVMSMV